MSDLREIALVTAKAGVRLNELAAAIIRAANDGDTHTAVAACAEVLEIAGALSHTHWLAADGNLADAKKSALNMVKTGKELL